MDLMIRKNFRSHSGLDLTWKLEADVITDETWETAAMIVDSKLQFTHVYGIPTGGEKFAKALEKYCTPMDERLLLIVDDVLTTGGSMEKVKAQLTDDYDYIAGTVLFARGKFPKWVRPVWILGDSFSD